MSKETKVGRHAAPETDAAGRSGSFAEGLIDILSEHFIDGESATEREARETAKTAVRVGGKAKVKADFWLRVVYGTFMGYILALIGTAMMPSEALEQVLIAIPIVSAAAVTMWQASIVTGSYLWKETRPLAKRLIATIAYMEVFAIIAWILPIHTNRKLILPFVAMLITIWLFKKSGQKSVMPKLLWIAAAVIALIFLFSGINLPSVEVENSSQFMGYTSGAPTSPAPSPATPQATASPSTDKPEPTVNTFPEEEANLATRQDVSPDFAQAGQLVQSTIVIENHSQVEAKNVQVTIELPQGLQFADTGLRAKEVNLGNIPANGETSINSTILVEGDAPAGGYDSWIHVRADNQPEYSVPQALIVSES